MFLFNWFHGCSLKKCLQEVNKKIMYYDIFFSAAEIPIWKETCKKLLIPPRPCLFLWRAADEEINNRPEIPIRPSNAAQQSSPLLRFPEECWWEKRRNSHGRKWRGSTCGEEEVEEKTTFTSNQGILLFPKREQHTLNVKYTISTQPCQRLDLHKPICSLLFHRPPTGWPDWLMTAHLSWCSTCSVYGVSADTQTVYLICAKLALSVIALPLPATACTHWFTSGEWWRVQREERVWRKGAWRIQEKDRK